FDVHADEVLAEQEEVAGLEAGGGHEADEGPVRGTEVAQADLRALDADGGVARGNVAVVGEDHVTGEAADQVFAFAQREDLAEDPALQDLHEAVAVARVGRAPDQGAVRRGCGGGLHRIEAEELAPEPDLGARRETRLAAQAPVGAVARSEVLHAEPAVREGDAAVAGADEGIVEEGEWTVVAPDDPLGVGEGPEALLHGGGGGG